MRDALTQQVHAVEEAYELMLGYAAQGLAGDSGASGGELRSRLARAAAAIAGIPTTFAALIDGEALEPRDKYLAFHGVLRRDAASSLAAIELVLAQPSISSQLVDNLNASIHLRALLTDLFLLDELLKPRSVTT
jgi:hypothetical protein